MIMGLTTEPDGIASIYRLSYEECRDRLIRPSMETIQMYLVLKKNWVN